MTTSIAKPRRFQPHPAVARGLRITLTVIVVASLCVVSYNVGRLWHNWPHGSPSRELPDSPEFAALLETPSLAGQWTFADLNWSLRSQVMASTEVTAKFGAAANLTGGTVAGQLPDINQELINLARKLQIEPVVRGENQIYAYERANLKGQLVVRNVAGHLKAISLIAAFPKDANQWQVFAFTPCSIAASHADESTHLVALPASARRTGGRFSDDGQLLLELITLESTDGALVSLWKHNGWEVRPAHFAGPDDFCYLCARGAEVVYAWSADPRGSVRNLMLVRTSAGADVQSQARHAVNLE